MSSKATKSRNKPAAAAAPGGPQWWWYALGFFGALFAVFEIYQPAIRAPFLFDDNYLPFLHPDFANAPLRDWLSGVRPLLMLGYWFNYQVSHTEPYSYHVLNVLLHAANAALVWLCVSRILEWTQTSAPLRALLAIFSGLLFLLHPIQTESVTYVASRSESQSLVFFLAAFAVFLYRRRQGVSIRATAAILLLYGAAVATKEHAAVLPALLLLTDFFWNPPFSFQGIRRNWRLYGTIAACALGAAAFIARILAGAPSAGFGMKDLPWYQYFFTQCRAIWVYLRMFLLPYGLNVDHDFAISRGLTDHGAILGLIALAAVSAAAWIWRNRFPLASYGWFAFLILIAPTSSFVPIRDVLVERRVYLAFLPLTLIACDFLRRVPLRTSSLAPVLGLVLVAFSAATYARNQVWSDPLSLWSDTASKSPAKSRPAFQLAYALYSAGRCPEAMDQYAKVAQLQKPDYSLYVDWGLAADCARQPDTALEKFRLAAAIEPSAHAWSLIGMVYAKQNKKAEAVAALDESSRINPRYAITYVYRGNILLLDRDFERAAAEFRKALDLNPADANARNGLDLAQRRVVPNVQ